MKVIPVLLLVFTAARAWCQAETRVHVVQPGDTLPRLVWLYNVRADRIRAVNGLRSDALESGTRLVIPTMSAAAAQPGGVQVARAEPVPIARAQAEPPPEPAVERPDEDAFAVQAVPAEPASARPERNGFREVIQIPASQNIRYNGRWIPPGEGSAWVMDCSNTARWLYREVRGVELPRTASDQYEWLRQRRKLWKARPDAKSLRKKLQPGDLLFWENTYKPPRKPPVTHVMVYLGTDAQGRMMMAGSQGSSGPDVYPFRPEQRMGGYRFFFFFRRDGKFVAYGRP